MTPGRDEVERVAEVIANSAHRTSVKHGRLKHPPMWDDCEEVIRSCIRDMARAVLAALFEGGSLPCNPGAEIGVIE